MYTHFKDGSVWLVRLPGEMCPLPPLGARVGTDHVWEPSMFFKQGVGSQVILNQQESLCGVTVGKGAAV